MHLTGRDTAPRRRQAEARIRIVVGIRRAAQDGGVRQVLRIHRVTVEHEHYDREGNHRSVEIHAFPIFDSKGDVTQVAEYVSDITERKKAEEMLKWELAVNSALSECFKPLVSPLSSIENMAKTILEMAKKLTGSRHGYVSSIEPSTGDNVRHTITEMYKDHCKIPDQNMEIIFRKGKDGLYPGLWGHCLNTLTGLRDMPVIRV